MKEEFNVNDYLESFSEDELFDGVLIIPYMEDEFKRWLIENRQITEESASRYINHYMSAYERLFEVVGLDLYDLLRKFIEEIPAKTGNTLTKEGAVDLAICYVEAIQEELDRDNDSYTKEELRAILAYRDFIAFIAGEDSMTEYKTINLPFGDEFIDWLCDELGMDYENAKKEASAARTVGSLLNHLVDRDGNLIEFASTLKNKDNREEILANLIDARGLHNGEDKATKTLQNGISSLKKYFLFLNDKNK
ncbi:MAG: hypothetical protein J1F07_07575 [Muribaculaceae bacterium]|nr:hypothetical protein [Muribaculaceae bacterium]